MAVSLASGLDHPALLGLLADGGLHSGESLALTLGVSRTAVWKAVLRLRQRGVEIAALPRRGYRLPYAVELLHAERIRDAIARPALERLRSLSVSFEVDSTNSRLLAAAPPPHGQADVMLAEVQRAGRGRRGRPWLAPFGASLALSLAWSFRDAAAASPTLSLCVGVAVARALARAGARGVGLKWPNDVWLVDRKVGGILIELRAEASGPAHVVIGVGVNVALAPELKSRMDEAGLKAAAVADACALPPSRNFIAGAIIGELLSMLADFERDGFAPFHAAWTALDVLRDRPARVLVGESSVTGTARGANVRGALLLERDGRLEEFVSGEVSLRGVEQS